ncbi:MAG: class I adenylate-forming enzyme family protein, partial [Acidimicrobiales bacterium]
SGRAVPIFPITLGDQPTGAKRRRAQRRNSWSNVVNASLTADGLTGPGAPFEIVEEVVLGERMPVFKNRPRSARELLLDSARHGDLHYIVHDDQRVSFDEHLQRVAAFAHVLREEFGVTSGDRVAILAANGPEWIIAFWATLSIGGVIASMNSLWAPPEIEHALASCEPTVLIADRARRARVPARHDGVSYRTIEVESEFESLVARGRGAAISDVPIDEDDPAVILYTSGTTGRSKGAVASHRSICGFVTLSRYSGAAAMAAAGAGVAPAVGTRQIALITVPLFHASGLYGFVVGQLATGGTVVLRSGRFDEDDVLRLIEREGVTMWAALGSMGPRVAERAPGCGRDLSSMRLLAVGGAPVSPAHQQQLRDAFPNASINISMGYTSSEAVAVVTRIQGQEMRDHPTSAGRVIATTSLEIRDPDGQPVAEGVDGEIHVRSPYLMLEYWRDEHATRAALKPGRWLAMGDIGCLRDGRLYINSRARDMILVNAENVFPTEVEYRLDAHPDVRECAVVGVDDPVTGQAIRAVVVVPDGTTLGVAALDRWCRDALAGYKVPTQWEIRHEALPRNASGKVLKRELEQASQPAEA